MCMELQLWIVVNGMNLSLDTKNMVVYHITILVIQYQANSSSPIYNWISSNHEFGTWTNIEPEMVQHINSRSRFRFRI